MRTRAAGLSPLSGDLAFLSISGQRSPRTRDGLRLPERSRRSRRPSLGTIRSVRLRKPAALPLGNHRPLRTRYHRVTQGIRIRVAPGGILIIENTTGPRPALLLSFLKAPGLTVVRIAGHAFSHFTPAGISSFRVPLPEAMSLPPPRFSPFRENRPMLDGLARDSILDKLE